MIEVLPEHVADVLKDIPVITNNPYASSPYQIADVELIDGRFTPVIFIAQTSSDSASNRKSDEEDAIFDLSRVSSFIRKSSPPPDLTTLSPSRCKAVFSSKTALPLIFSTAILSGGETIRWSGASSFDLKCLDGALYSAHASRSDAHVCIELPDNRSIDEIEKILPYTGDHPLAKRKSPSTCIYIAE